MRPGPAGPLGVRPHGRQEEGISSLGRPAGRVVGELHERTAADAGDDVQVGQQPDAVGPGVRGEPSVPSEGDLGDGPGPEHPAGQHDVGLVHVEGIGIEGSQRLAERPGHLATGDPHPGGRRAQASKTAQVRAGQRFLEPQDPVIGQAGGNAASGDRIDRRTGVTGHPPALIEIDHDRHRVADGRTGRRDRSQAIHQVARVDADLEGLEALLAEPQRGLGAGGWREQRAARGIGGDPAGRPAEQGRDGQAGDLAGDVPKRRLERPEASGVEIDRLEDADMPGDRERILVQEQVLIRLEPGHRVARPDPDHARIRLDPHDRRRERRPGDGVPGGIEWRVEGDDEPRALDAADPHDPSMAQSGAR